MFVVVGGDSCKGKTRNSFNRIQIIMLSESKVRDTRNVAVSSLTAAPAGPTQTLQHLPPQPSQPSLTPSSSELDLRENDQWMLLGCIKPNGFLVQVSRPVCHDLNSKFQRLFNDMGIVHTTGNLKSSKFSFVCLGETTRPNIKIAILE